MERILRSDDSTIYQIPRCSHMSNMHTKHPHHAKMVGLCDQNFGHTSVKEILYSDLTTGTARRSDTRTPKAPPKILDFDPESWPWKRLAQDSSPWRSKVKKADVYLSQSALLRLRRNVRRRSQPAAPPRTIHLLQCPVLSCPVLSCRRNAEL